MALDVFVVWFAFFWCLITIAIIVYLIHVRRDALNPMRWARVIVFSGLALIYASRLVGFIDPRLSTIIARFFIVPTCIVLGILPSMFKESELFRFGQTKESEETLARLEAALKKATEK